MKILLVGSGAREHALAWALHKSPGVTSLVVAPGNPGIGAIARLSPMRAEDVGGLVGLARAEGVDLVVVGPEVPLVAGLVDALSVHGIPAFGPTRAAAQLEGSKSFTKDFCARHSIPTADYRVFTDRFHAKAYLAEVEPPYVLKADGLAAGKGVIIAETRREADEAIDRILDGVFGGTDAKLVIEEYMPGEEVSVFALCDGERAVLFGAAQDHKRAFDGDIGPNTGGMGAYSPAPIFTDAVADEVMNRIILPTVQGMAAEGHPFRGVLFAGLMITEAGPRLIEYNARFGDPECQVLMRRYRGDLAKLLMACATGTLDDAARAQVVFDKRSAVAVVMAANGYPDTPLKGSEIIGIERANAVDGVVVFHAATQKLDDGSILADGGRVLTVTSLADGIGPAIDLAYDGVERIDWRGGFYRRDIGWRALTRGVSAGEDEI
jgi:phosphoribosylamine---glycine ligase